MVLAYTLQLNEVSKLQAKKKSERILSILVIIFLDQSELVDLLIKKGANINVRNDLQRTPLHLAAKSGSKNVAEMLINNGADINVIDMNGDTPMHIAARNSNENILLVND